jgi:hypothetical protein
MADLVKYPHPTLSQRERVKTGKCSFSLWEKVRMRVLSWEVAHG